MKLKSDRGIWSTSLIMLWQGQLVSCLGDQAYNIALGFWVLAATGSTALMGTLMAASTLPGVLISPFAGVIVDRTSRKKLLITMDLLRGICVVSLSIMAYTGKLKIWMLFFTGIVLSICTAIFSPGVNSVIPDLVTKEKITNANSIFAVASNGASMVGSAFGGFLFQIIGSCLMFLFNGISFLFSGISLLFVKVPVVKKEEDKNFFEDLKDGFYFIWKLKGLRYVIIMAAFINFFFNIALVLFLPLFQKTNYLGAAKYGIVMAAFMLGALVGFIITSIINIKSKDKLKLFMLANLISDISLIICVNGKSILLMLITVFIGGIFNSIVNVLIISTVQSVTPANMRGKVLSFINMVTQGLTPFAMILGGMLGVIFPISKIMTVCFSIVLLLVVPFAFNREFEKFIKFDCINGLIEDIL